MEILVYGAGVVGSQYAARLRQAGHMVSLLARGLRAVELREHGIVLEAANTGRTETVHVSVKETLEEDDRFELVIIALRKNQIADALPVLAANRQTPNLLFLGNNPIGLTEIVNAVGRERVLLGFGGVGGNASRIHDPLLCPPRTLLWAHLPGRAGRVGFQPPDQYRDCPDRSASQPRTGAQYGRLAQVACRPDQPAGAGGLLGGWGYLSPGAYARQPAAGGASRA